MLPGLAEVQASLLVERLLSNVAHSSAGSEDAPDIIGLMGRTFAVLMPEKDVLQEVQYCLFARKRLMGCRLSDLFGVGLLLFYSRLDSALRVSYSFCRSVWV